MDGHFVLLGDGGQADEIEAYLASLKNSVVARLVDRRYVSFHNMDIAKYNSEFKENPVIIAVGAPGMKKQFHDKMPESVRYGKVVARSASVDATSIIGEGTVVSERAVVTTNVNIGKHVLINVGATISHNTVIGDFSTISPGANVAGNVKLGRGVFVGIGAVISDNISITDGVVIGAGAVVVKDIDKRNTVYVGIPAKEIGENDGWLVKI